MENIPDTTRSAGKYGRSSLFVEIVQGAALFLGPIPYVPRFQLLPGEDLQRGIFPGKKRIRFRFQIFEKFHRLLAFVGHAIVQYEIGKIGEAEQPGFFPAQFQNARQQRPVVPLRLGCARGIGAVHLLADLAVVEISQDRHVARRLEREAPSFNLLRRGALPCRIDGAGREPGQLRFIADDQFKCVGGIQNILGKFRRDLREFDIDLGHARFARGIQFRAMPLEGVQRLREKTQSRRTQRLCLIGRGVTLQLLP